MGLSFEAASALPMVFLTNFFALKEQAGLKHEDCILIHSAAVSVGSAAGEGVVIAVVAAAVAAAVALVVASADKVVDIVAPRGGKIQLQKCP